MKIQIDTQSIVNLKRLFNSKNTIFIAKYIALKTSWWVSFHGNIIFYVVKDRIIKDCKRCRVFNLWNVVRKRPTTDK